MCAHCQKRGKAHPGELVEVCLQRDAVELQDAELRREVHQRDLLHGLVVVVIADKNVLQSAHVAEVVVRVVARVEHGLAARIFFTLQ